MTNIQARKKKKKKQDKYYFWDIVSYGTIVLAF
jgi:hypothetical protein